MSERPVRSVFPNRASEPSASPDRSRLNVLFAAFQGTFAANGGMESATRIAEALASEVAFTLVTDKELRFTQRWRVTGAGVRLIAFDDTAPRFARGVQMARRTAQMIPLALSLRPDLVHTNDIRAFQTVWRAARLASIPLVHAARDTKAKGDPYGPGWYRAAATCDRWVILSQEMGTVLSAAVGVPQDRLVVINSIVDLMRFTPPAAADRASLRQRLGIGADELALGSIGALRPKKDQLSLIEHTLPAVFARVPNAKLHVLGDYDPETEPYAAVCRDAIDRLGLSDRVVFHGHCDTMVDWYRALDLTVIASQNEGLARCMIESMACGLPVVSTSVCSATEMLAETGAGLVTPIGDHMRLGQAIVHLAERPQERETMGRRGREVALARFAEERCASAHCELYRSLLRTVVTPAAPTAS